jgi:cellulose synthase/poly-beta-1,6-N-acetylglucosamine synthase-like glycosyltransferase
MLVSIITICYSATIAKAIESVLNQDYPNIEYIVIDGNSLMGLWILSNLILVKSLPIFQNG